MIFSSICVQINTMFTKKEFKVAAVIALFYSCFAFAFTLTEFSGIDISKIKDANQLVCFSQSNRLWFFFSLPGGNIDIRAVRRVPFGHPVRCGAFLLPELQLGRKSVHAAV